MNDLQYFLCLTHSVTFADLCGYKAL